MAAEVFGTPQYDITTSSRTTNFGALSAVGHYALESWSGSPPSWTSVPAPANSVGQGVLALISNTTVADKPNAVVLSFLGTGDAGKLAKARVWGFTKTSWGQEGAEAYLGIYLGSLDLTLGTADAGAVETGAKFVDTIAVDEDASPTPPGMCVFGDAANGVACVRIDTMGFQALIVEYTRSGDTSGFMSKVGFMWRTI